MLKLKTLLLGSSIVSTILGGIWAFQDHTPSMPIVVKVKPGDTLWSIAQHYNGGNSNTGDVVYWIEKENHLTSEVLQPSQKLHVPAPSGNN